MLNFSIKFILQGKPTEASKDLKVLQYAEKDTKTYLPGKWLS